jgi:hypothetical protein
MDTSDVHIQIILHLEENLQEILKYYLVVKKLKKMIL